MIGKRVLDLTFSSAGLVLFSPMFLLIAVLIKLDSAGPVFFRQERIGKGEHPFRIHKFRTMITGEEKRDSQLTIGDDRRITRTGRWLRRYKLDELPQLIDVIRGDMSIVGPRPEVPRYVERYPAKLREIVFSVRPGITDLASIEYKDENLILSRSNDPEKDYLENILPRKLEYYCEYVEQRSILLDLRIIGKTLLAIVR